VNDSIVFSFQLEDIDPGSLECDTIPLETNTLLVAQVYCQTAPGDSCFIYSITSTQIQFKPIFKDYLAFGKYTAASIPNGPAGETITIQYAIKNTGTDTVNSSTVQVLFVHDANNNGIPDDTGADSLFLQTVSTGGILAGDSTVATATFNVPAGKVCKMIAAIRLSDNGCICGDAVMPVNYIHLLNAGPDVEVCMQTNVQLGMAGITGYNYYWVPTLFLSSPSIPDPIFNYNTLLTQADTTNYILNTTRPGNCVSRDTTQVIVLPSAVVFAGADTVACIGYPHLLADASAINSTNTLWSTSGSGTFNDPTLVNAIYSPSPTDYVTGSVTLSLFADGLCGDDTDAMILTFNQPATSNAGPDTAVCANWTYTIAGAFASNYTNLLWTTTGDGAFSNTAILNPIYTPGPTDISSGSVALVLHVTGFTSCPVMNDTLILVLTPPPVVTNSPPAKTICSEEFTGIALTSSQTGTSFSWTAVLTSDTVNGFNDGSGDTIDQQLFNPGLTPGIVTYTITPNNGGCIGLSLAYQVTVNPLPEITNTNTDTSFCSGGTTGINLLSNISGTSFSWIATATSPFIQGYVNGSDSSITQLLTNTGVEPDTVIYAVTPTLNSCSGSDSLFFVTVFPLPEVLANPVSISFCSGDTTLIGLSSPVAGSGFSWTAVASSLNISGYGPGSGDTITQILVNSGTSIDTVWYSVTATANGCTGSDLIIPVVVNPIPSVTGALTPQTICSGDIVLFLLESNVAGTAFSWIAATSGNLTGFFSGSGDTILQVVSNTGYTIDTVFFLITPSANGCQGDATLAYALVMPVPDLSNTPLSTGICNDGWTNTNLLSNVINTTFTWNCTQVSGSITGWSDNPLPTTLLDQQLSNSGSTTDSVVYHMVPEANGCTGPVTDYTFSVYPLPDVSFNPPSPVVCSGEVTAIQCVSQVPSSTFTWATSVNPNVSGNNPGSGSIITDTLVNPGTLIETIFYIVTPEAFGCPPGIPDTVYVLVNPLPEVTNAIRTFTICNLDPFQILLQANLPYPTSFSWIASCSSPTVSGYSNGTGGTIQQPLSNSGFNVDTVIYVVTPESNNCDGDTAHFQVVVFPVPDVIITPPVDTICSADTCLLDLTSHVAGTSFEWTVTPGSIYLSGFAGGSGNQIAQQLFTSAFNPGSVTYTVFPTANGCPGTQAQVVVTVKPSPVVTLPVCFDTVTTTGARPIFLRGGVPPEGFFSGNYVSGSTFDPVAAGPGTHPIWYSYTNRFSCTRSDTMRIAVLSEPPFICGDTIVDVRDGTSYPTVQIGAQCWLAANLNYGTQVLHQVMHRDNCIPEKYCYLNQVARCTSEGGLYQWDEVMEYREDPGVKGLCPPGWHIPTEDEWNILFANYINNGFAGNPLKITGYSGFNAPLGGVRFNNKVWRLGPEEPVINTTFIWSSTAHGPRKAWAHGLTDLLADHEYTPSVSFYPSSRINAFTARCLKD
ncbi:MAG: PKD-like domain-containing protein, partial [Bacteroidota bacterium]